MEAYVFYKKNGNKLWKEGIKEEMNTLIEAAQESNVSPENLIFLSGDKTAHDIWYQVGQ